MRCGSPFYASGDADFGYDVTDHCAVDPRMGDLATFDALLAEARARGLRVLVDYVPNHTSIEHPWFADSRTSRQAARRDWYVWADPRRDGGPPNNWRSVFGGSAWTRDPPTGQYYLHSFLGEQPDLNWRNPDVEAAMLDVLRFWMDRGVDGFRIDAAEHLLADPELRDNPPSETGDPQAKRLGEYDTQRHLHDRGHPDVHALYRRIRRRLDRHPSGPRVALAEIVPEPGVGLAHWASFYGRALDEIHLPLNLTLPSLPWDAAAFQDTVDAVERAVPAGGWPTIVLGSHDERRVASRYGPDQARCLLVVLLTLRGTPVLFNGDELALTDSPVPAGEARDPWGRRQAEFNRDRGRAPMPWTSGDHAGFTAGAQPWLPLPEHPQALSVGVQAEDPESTLTLTRRLLALRRDLPVLRRGGYVSVRGPADVLAYERRDDTHRVRVLANFAQDARRVALDGAGWELAVSSSGEAALDADAPALGAHAAAVLVRHTS